MTVADAHASDYDPTKPANIPPLASNMVLVNKDEHSETRDALRAVWDEYSELMPDELHDQVKKALGIREFHGVMRPSADDFDDNETAGRDFH